MASDSKKGQQMWGGRFAAQPSDIMQSINASIDVDRRMVREDIAGSRAHADMLAEQGIISEDDNVAIQDGLDQVVAEVRTALSLPRRAGRHSHECRGAAERADRRTGRAPAHGALAQ